MGVRSSPTFFTQEKPARETLVSAQHGLRYGGYDESKIWKSQETEGC
jgi:hypothetical protein